MEFSLAKRYSILGVLGQLSGQEPTPGKVDPPSALLKKQANKWNDFLTEILFFPSPSPHPIEQSPSHHELQLCLFWGLIQTFSSFFSLSNTNQDLYAWPELRDFLFLWSLPHHMAACLSCVWPPCQLKCHGFLSFLLWSATEISSLLALKVLF